MILVLLGVVADGTAEPPTRIEVPLEPGTTHVNVRACIDAEGRVSLHVLPDSAVVIDGGDLMLALDHANPPCEDDC